MSIVLRVFEDQRCWGTLTRCGGWSLSSNLNRRSSLDWQGSLCRLSQLRSQAPHQFGSHVGDAHTFRYEKFTAQNGARLIIIRELATYFAILTFLVPAKAAVRHRLRADELKCAQQRVSFRHQKGLAENGDLDKFLVGPKHFSHERRAGIGHVA
jgi:hypothetical protein